jgi:hypothetical protein
MTTTTTTSTNNNNNNNIASEQFSQIFPSLIYRFRDNLIKRCLRYRRCRCCPKRIFFLLRAACHTLIFPPHNVNKLFIIVTMLFFSFFFTSIAAAAA